MSVLNHQNYAFQFPFLNYICQNGSFNVKLKLMKSCKQLGTKIQRQNFYKFDALVILSRDSGQKLKLIDGKIVFLVNSEFEFCNVVNARHIDIRTTMYRAIISKINIDFVTELRLSDLTRISYISFKKFLTANLIRLKLCNTVISGVKNAGLQILRNACNLKFLDIQIKNISSLKEMAMFEGEIQLEKCTITHIRSEIDVTSIALFIRNRISPEGNLILYFTFPQYTKILGAELNERADDFHDLFNVKIGVLSIIFVKI